MSARCSSRACNFVKKWPCRVVAPSLLILLAWAYYPFIEDSTLTFKWEGLFPSKMNFRDFGKSISDCMGQANYLDSSRNFRSNEFFSGWGCQRIGDPDVIFSLNYAQDKAESYYCRPEHGPIRKGQSFNKIELFDLEFEQRWFSRSFDLLSVCKVIHGVMQANKEGKKSLIHCEAGRDRTGAVTALLGGLLMESKYNRPISDREIEALECDYRKSRSLSPEKYGRIQNFVSDIVKKYGGVTSFIATVCTDLTPKEGL
jgi:hypothetical protein